MTHVNSSKDQTRSCERWFRCVMFLMVILLLGSFGYGMSNMSNGKYGMRNMRKSKLDMSNMSGKYDA